ncbi:MAG: mechanosensitive ion channel family protein [Pseudomonadota bacterium]
MSASAQEEASEKPESSPVTTGNPEIPLDELEFMLKPLSIEELSSEAEGWFKLLKEAEIKFAAAHVAVKRQNSGIKEIEDATTRDDKQEDASVVEESIREQTEQASDKSGEAANDEKKEGAEKKKTKQQLLDHLNELRVKRTEMIDRLNAVLDELAAKSGETDSAVTTSIAQYRLYTQAVQGIAVDIKDASSTWAAVKGWVMSEEGGMRWLLNLLKVAAILIAFYFLGRLAGKAVQKASAVMQNPSQLLQRFLVQSVQRLFIAIGILMALSAMEVSIAPLLAVIGAAGLVIGLALQGTLSNFASGILILFYRPFDVGDFIEAGGISGSVTAMNLVSTVITTPDNKRMIVPNNSIWEGVITNVSGVTRRRLEMQFGIGYQDDADKAQRLLEEIVTSHAKVLKDPEPVIKLHELGASSVNFICRPWTLPGDYWAVYWDITREVKARFDKEGISIPFPQQDIHLYSEKSPETAS